MEETIDAGKMEEEEKEEKKDEENNGADDTDDTIDAIQTPSLQPFGQEMPMALNRPSAPQKPSFSCVTVAQ